MFSLMSFSPLVMKRLTPSMYLGAIGLALLVRWRRRPNPRLARGTIWNPLVKHELGPVLLFLGAECVQDRGKTGT